MDISKAFEGAFNRIFRYIVYTYIAVSGLIIP